MRLIAFERNGSAALGVRDGDRLLDLSRIEPGLPADVSAVLRDQDGGVERLRELAAGAPADAWEPLSEALGDASTTRRHLPPARRAGKILCLGLNYVDHAAEAGLTKPDYPVVFMRAATSLAGHGHPIVRPRVSEQLDYEAELVAIVGRSGRHIAPADALSHIAGYSVFNDGSVRDYQLRTSQWAVGKNFDATGGFGPEFVTADELPPGAKGLRIQCRLNGETVQDANTEDMVFDVAETVVLLSQSMTLEAGDLLVMGTPSGVGMVRKPPLWMKDGDVCEVEIEGIGVLRNPIVAER